jgi:hypothetical protein
MALVTQVIFRGSVRMAIPFLKNWLYWGRLWLRPRHQRGAPLFPDA